MKNYNTGTIFCLVCLLAIGFGGTRILKLESRLGELEDQLAITPHIVSAKWVGAGRIGEPKKNAAFYLPWRGNPVIQIMDGQYPIANFAITIHDREVIMQLIQDGEVRIKKLWELTDESDFVRQVGGVK